MAKDEELPYDDDDAVKHIRKTIDAEVSKRISDDDIYYIIDLIYDFYESKGFINEGEENLQVTFADDEIIDYAVSNVKKDGFCKMTVDEITAIIEGELSYCESIGIFK
ncbi:MAG: hypothetical protein RR015_02670 [Bacteroidales bacterium]